MSSIKEAPGTPARHRRKEARPSELTAAALELFVEKGFAATRLDEIAARAGVSKGTLYLYFDSKEALFEAVIQEGVVPLIEAGEALVNASPADLAALSLYSGESELAAIAARAGLTPGASYLQFNAEHDTNELVAVREHHERLLEAILKGWWDRIGASPLGGIPKLMMAESANFPEVARYFHEQVIQRGRRLVGAVLSSGMQRGVFRAVDLEQTISLFMAPCIHLAMSRRSLAFCVPADTNPHEFIDNYLQIFLLGIRA